MGNSAKAAKTPTAPAVPVTQSADEYAFPKKYWKMLANRAVLVQFQNVCLAR